MALTTKGSTIVAKTLLLFFALFIAIIFLIRVPLSSSVARTQERVFENTIPKDVPIKIKIKKEKEKSFKDLKDENWVREFELEITNTGDKPIYFVYIELITDVNLGNVPLVFSLVYGRTELGDIITMAGPDDIPIKPGDMHVFKIHPGQVPAWEMSLREKSHPDASSIKARLELLSFGDGNGYFGNQPYPPADKGQSKLNDQSQPRNKGGTKTLMWSARQPGTQTSSIFCTGILRPKLSLRAQGC